MLFFSFFRCEMPRVHKRKTQRTSHRACVLKDVLQAMQDGSPLKIERTYNIPCKILRRHRDGESQEFWWRTWGHVSVISRKWKKESIWPHTYFSAFDFAEKRKLSNQFCKTYKMAGKYWLSGAFKTPNTQKKEKSIFKETAAYNVNNNSNINNSNNDYNDNKKQKQW